MSTVGRPKLAFPHYSDPWQNVGGGAEYIYRILCGLDFERDAKVELEGGLTAAPALTTLNVLLLWPGETAVNDTIQFTERMYNNIKDGKGSWPVSAFRTLGRRTSAARASRVATCPCAAECAGRSRCSRLVPS